MATAAYRQFRGHHADRVQGAVAGRSD